MKRLILGVITMGMVSAANAATPMMKTIGNDVLIGEKSTKNIIRNRTLPKKPAIGYKATGIETDVPKNGYVLYENFSGWDEKEKYWTPDGWSVEHRGECEKDFTWTAMKPTAYYPTIADGEYCFCIGYNNLQDEWLISPTFIPEKNMLLSYYMRLCPLYFYDIKNLDFTTGEYNGDKNIVYTIQILIKEEGEGNDWSLLHDYAEEYKDFNYWELSDASNGESLEKQTIEIDDYIGKNVRVAFRYVGSDGDLVMLDAIGVGYPTLDKVWYMEPINSLYWGFGGGSDLLQMTSDIAVYPANTSIIWQNMSEEDATYTWQYMDKNKEYAVSYDSEILNITYPSEEQGLTPKLYETPTLTAEAPERIDGFYRSPVAYFQVGGKPSYTDKNGKWDFTLFQYPMNHLGVTYTSVMDDQLGAFSIPVFGYNEFSDAYWLNYSLNGEKPIDGNYSHLIGIGNLFYASTETPLTVKGMSVYGWGRIADDAELTATIYALDSEMHTDYETYTVIASAKITGKEIESVDEKTSKDYLYLPFKFDEPVAIQASEDHPAFLFMLEGFHSDKVDYFAPLQANQPNQIGYSAGYILNEINLQGHVEEGTYRSLKRMQYMENGTYYYHAGAFAIGLDAEYPISITDPGAVDSLGSEKGVEAIYDLNGRKVASTSEGGIYIARCKDGTVKKICTK